MGAEFSERRFWADVKGRKVLNAFQHQRRNCSAPVLLRRAEIWCDQSLCHTADPDSSVTVRAFANAKRPTFCQQASCS